MLSNKYGIDFPIATIEKNVTRLTNQMWKLIPMRENSEDWKKQLETVTIEVAGLNELFLQDSQFLQLLAKLNSLVAVEMNFSTYRKTVFECINLLQGVFKNYERA